MARSRMRFSAICNAILARVTNISREFVTIGRREIVVGLNQLEFCGDLSLMFCASVYQVYDLLWNSSISLNKLRTESFSFPCCVVESDCTGLIFASDCAFVLLFCYNVGKYFFLFCFICLFVCLFVFDRSKRVLHSLLAYPIIMTHLFRFWNGTDVQWRVCSWKSPSSGSVSTSTTRRLRHSWKSFEKGTTDCTQNDYWNGKFVILGQKFPGFSFISPGCWWNPDEAFTPVLSGPHKRGQERRRVRSLLRILGT